MCGISAIINSTAKRVSPELLKRMNASIEHRGPDGEDYFLAGRVGLGHRMLKITDLGPENVQPMRFRSYVVTYNGEIYNFREIRQTLKRKGYLFHTETDTEVLLAAYDAWKEDCVHYFNGMWAFVLFDQERDLVFASRDRFGIKPLCYAQLNGRFVLASEIKQLTTFTDFNAKLNHSAAFDFLYSGRLNANHQSLFESVQFLPPGSNLLYDLHSNTYEINRWYELKCLEQKLDITLPEATAKFHQYFTEAVGSHLYSQVPVGSCLSGGMDSTSLVGVATIAGIPLKTYSSCFAADEYNELAYINAAVEHYQLENYKIYPELDDLITNGELERLVYLQDQPITCGSFFTEYKIYELAARHRTRVILGGGGADEYLGGYGEFFPVFLKALLKKKSYLTYISEFVQIPRLKIRLVESVQQYLHLFSKAKGPVSNEYLQKSFKEEWINRHFHEEESPFDKRDMADLSIFELTSFSLPHQLHSEDRSSMHFSLESRVPFLDHRLVEFCLSIPDRYKLRNGTTKYLLRESLRSILPPLVYNRKNKIGMPGPDECIFKHNIPEIKNYFRDLTWNFPDIFNTEVLAMLDNYAEGRIPYDNFLFRVLSFGAWTKAFNISSTSSAKKKRAVTKKTSIKKKQEDYVVVKN